MFAPPKHFSLTASSPKDSRCALREDSFGSTPYMSPSSWRLLCQCQQLATVMRKMIYAAKDKAITPWAAKPYRMQCTCKLDLVNRNSPLPVHEDFQIRRAYPFLLQMCCSGASIMCMISQNGKSRTYRYRRDGPGKRGWVARPTESRGRAHRRGIAGRANWSREPPRCGHGRPQAAHSSMSDGFFHGLAPACLPSSSSRLPIQSSPHTRSASQGCWPSSVTQCDRMPSLVCLKFTHRTNSFLDVDQHSCRLQKKAQLVHTSHKLLNLHTIDLKFVTGVPAIHASNNEASNISLRVLSRLCLKVSKHFAIGQENLIRNSGVHGKKRSWEKMVLKASDRTLKESPTESNKIPRPSSWLYSPHTQGMANSLVVV